jgi:hypothetical protein
MMNLGAFKDCIPPPGIKSNMVCNVIIPANYPFSFLCPGKQDKRLPISHSVFVQIETKFNQSVLGLFTISPTIFCINMCDTFLSYRANRHAHKQTQVKT